jgi:hypothetical protein
MTGDDIPANPSVLNTTVLSNFVYIDQLKTLVRLYREERVTESVG